jgi:hypothetical protein
MLNFESFFDLKKPILEYNDQEAKEILNLLKSNYRNRRIILTKDEFAPKTIPHHQQQTRAKPKGTWYSLGEYWARWLTSEMPHWWGNYNNVYMLDLDYSKILRINNEAKMNAFVNEYQMDELYCRLGLCRTRLFRYRNHSHGMGQKKFILV